MAVLVLTAMQCYTFGKRYRKTVKILLRASDFLDLLPDLNRAKLGVGS